MKQYVVCFHGKTLRTCGTAGEGQNVVRLTRGVRSRYAFSKAWTPIKSDVSNMGHSVNDLDLDGLRASQAQLTRKSTKLFLFYLVSFRLPRKSPLGKL